DFDKLEKYQADKIWPAIPDAKPILGPWWNPPHYALMMSTIARLPFDEALNAWTIFGFACVITSAWLLARHVQRITNDGPKSWMLAPLFLLASYPCIQALGHGQNTPLSLLLLTLTALAWRARRGLLAGVLCGLMVYKPQLSALVGLMLVLTLGKRPLIGMLAVGIVTILASEFAMPGMIDRFIEVTPLNLARIMGADDYLWHRHATILALTKLGAFDRSSNLVDVISFVGRAFVFGTLLVGLWQARSSQSPSRGLDRVIVLTILATPLLMPFYFDYDLLLLAVAGVMLAASMRTESISTPFDRTILIVGLTWFVFSFFNVFIAGASQINIGTLMLLSLFALVARRIVWLARVETVMGRIPLIARA
ncbi:MAG TPA: glycosyltransferase family 87 protein, partial [Tepidisphaeraceae bacterium]|nr:glycosyltransferase family 87 protein [Tepidisphaeraceae bacterium]